MGHCFIFKFPPKVVGHIFGPLVGIVEIGELADTLFYITLLLKHVEFARHYDLNVSLKKMRKIEKVHHFEWRDETSTNRQYISLRR